MLVVKSVAVFVSCSDWPSPCLVLVVVIVCSQSTAFNWRRSDQFQLDIYMLHFSYQYIYIYIDLSSHSGDLGSLYVIVYRLCILKRNTVNLIIYKL